MAKSYRFNNGQFEFIGENTQNDDSIAFPGKVITQYSPDGDNSIEATNATITNLTAPTGRSAAYVIAASDATSLEKAQADVVCDGAADNIQWQAALDAGYKFIKGLGTTFTFAATVSKAVDDVTIDCEGFTTFSYNATNPIFTAGARTNWTFKNFKTDAGGLTYLTSTNYTLQNITIGTTFYPLLTDGTVSSNSFFTFAALPDTQQLAHHATADFDVMMSWIVANKDTEKIAYVAGLGDITEDASAGDMEAAKTAYDIIRAGGIPYSVATGSHDSDTNPGAAYTQYDTYFPYTYFSGYSWRGGYLTSNRTHYDLISACGVDFVILTIEGYFANEAAILPTIVWCNKVLTDYKERIAVIITHQYMAADGTLLGATWPTSGTICSQYLWTNCFKLHANVKLILCGHTDASFQNTQTGDNGNTVYQILAGMDSTGLNGWVKLIRFYPLSGAFYVRTYDTKNSAYVGNNDHVGYVANTFTISTAIPQPTYGWADYNYFYQRKISLNNAAITSTVTNAIIKVKLTSANFDFTKCQSAGQDIRFYDSNNSTELPYEIKLWDATNKYACIYVKKPSLVASSNNTDFIYMYYGNPYAVDGQDVANTWTDYLAVWHMKDATTETIADSLGVYTLTKKAANTPLETDTTVSGYTGRGQTFTNDYAGFTNALATGLIGVQDWSIECLMAQTNDKSASRQLFKMFNGAAGTRISLYNEITNGKPYSISRTGTETVVEYNSATDVSGGAYHYIALLSHMDTSAGATGYVNYYIDGTDRLSAQKNWGATTFQNSVGTGQIGDSDRSGGYQFAGVIEEMWLSKVLHTSDYFKVNRLNILDLFTNIGDEKGQ